MAQLEGLLAELQAGPAPAGEAASAGRAPVPDGPAAAARERLSEVTAKAPPSPRTRRRGRGQDEPSGSGGHGPAATGQHPPTTTARAATETDPAPDSTSGSAIAPGAEAGEATAPTGQPPATATPTTDPTATDPMTDPAAGPAPDGTTPPGGDGEGAGGSLTMAAVTAAFADQLEGVRQKVRVRFKGGQIVGVQGSTVTFGVPQLIHRDRCNEVKGEVEAALGDHFGQPVTIEVVVDDDAPAPTMDPAKIETSPVREITADEDVGPVEDLIDATDQSADGLERLTRAFPGSTVVEPQPE